MPCDVQWFIYALVSNGALSAEDAVAICNSITGEVTLESYAQAVLEQLAADCDEESAAALLEQIQEVVNYAAMQGAGGEYPPLELPETPAEMPEEAAVPAAAPVPRRGGAVPPPRRSGAVPLRSWCSDSRGQVKPEAVAEQETGNGGRNRA